MKTSPDLSHRSLLAVAFLAVLSLTPGGRLDADETPAPAAEKAPAPCPADPVALCWDAFEPAEWGKMTDCLQNTLKQQEAALEVALAQATAQAGQSMDKKSATRTLQKSNARWAEYRDAECDRQLAAVAGRNHPDIGELTCRIRETVQRIADLQCHE